MKCWLVLISYFIFLSCTAAANEETSDVASGSTRNYCEPSQQEIRNFVLKDPLLMDESQLLREGESMADLKRLALQPGPYGHSELGFRYLAKFFGYEGKSYDVRDVEAWILQGEYFTTDNRKGAFDIWKDWVVEPKKRLSVPRGNSEDIPTKQVTHVFFDGLEDKAKFAKCLSDALAKSACSSQSHLYRNQLMPNDRITVSKSSRDGRVHCLVTLSEGTEILKELDVKERRKPKSSTPASSFGGGGAVRGN